MDPQINPYEFTSMLSEVGIHFLSGVPDSILAPWLNTFSEESLLNIKHVIAVNECEAIALCSGYHLSSNKIGMVYMQNSGLGKTVNPLTSLTHSSVYTIPVLMLIGWRGEPGSNDDPQHQKMGEITLELLKLLDIPYTILENNPTDVKEAIDTAITYMQETRQPYALICKRGIFQIMENCPDYDLKDYRLDEELVLNKILDLSSTEDAIIGNCGQVARVLNAMRIKRNEPIQDFYVIGSLGCSAAIGLGTAIGSARKTLILDGDGGALMQLGSLTTIGVQSPTNLYHFILDNGRYNSTGGQPTVSSLIQFTQIAQASGYKDTFEITQEAELKNLAQILELPGPILILIKIARNTKKYPVRLQSPDLYKEKFQAKFQIEKK